MIFNRVRGLYLLTPDSSESAHFLEVLEKALKGAPSLVQYRNKKAPLKKRRYEAAAAAALCRAAGVPFVVNDDVDLALEIGADGVHLGITDGDLSVARRRIGPRRLLGASCYNDIGLARAAVAAGANYLAFGAVFPSVTKPAAVSASLALLAHAREQLSESGRVRIVAIGGITLENAGQAIEAGADLLAVISDVFNASDPGRRAAAYQTLIAKTSPTAGKDFCASGPSELRGSE